MADDAYVFEQCERHLTRTNEKLDKISSDISQIVTTVSQLVQQTRKLLEKFPKGSLNTPMNNCQFNGQQQISDNYSDDFLLAGDEQQQISAKVPDSHCVDQVCSDSMLPYASNSMDVKVYSAYSSMSDLIDASPQEYTSGLTCENAVVACGIHEMRNNAMVVTELRINDVRHNVPERIVNYLDFMLVYNDHMQVIRTVHGPKSRVQSTGVLAYGSQRIQLQMDSLPGNAKPYKHSHFKKNDMEKLVIEITTLSILWDFSCSLSTLVLGGYGEIICKVEFCIYKSK